MAAESDAHLVELARLGDHAAFTDLYRRFLPLVQSTARAHLKDSDLAADAVQETFVRALQSLPRLANLNRFRPWLVSIARHVAIDYARGAARTTAWDPALSDAIPDEAPDSDIQAQIEELAQLVRGCVGGLSRRDATVVSLIARLGFTPSELAAALGTSPSTAKVIAHRARQRLRDALVLELMVRRRGSGCAEFARLMDDGQTIKTARHVRTCPDCLKAAAEDVTAYDSSSATRSAEASPLGRASELPAVAPNPATSSDS
jgi:RNA polymerase sigma factor (sigma-70 family)